MELNTQHESGKVVSFIDAKKQKEIETKFSGYSEYLDSLKDEDLQYELGYLLTQFNATKLDNDTFNMSLKMFDQLATRVDGPLKDQILEIRNNLSDKIAFLNTNFHE